jgi:uridine kinase
VIPIILEQCEIPNKLKHLTYLDLTLDNNTLTQLQKLKDALLPVYEMIYNKTIYEYCEIIINRGIVILAHVMVHVNHKKIKSNEIQFSH